MENAELLFHSIPDTVFITDAYGFILDYNRTHPFECVKKGTRLKKLIPDCFSDVSGVFRFGEKYFRRSNSAIYSGEVLTGYTVMLEDVTEQTLLIEQLQKKNGELHTLAESLKKSNGELEAYVSQVKELTDYSEQLRIAQVLHDDAGHAITELHTICLMCLKLKESDSERYCELIDEGIGICDKAMKENKAAEYGSLCELLNTFSHLSSLPVVIRIEGDEPPFLKGKYPVIEKLLKEAYHNTLDHSLADEIGINVHLSNTGAALTFTDSGSFHGSFEKSFGLSSLEKNVRNSGGSIEFIAENGKGFTIAAKWRKGSQ